MREILPNFLIVGAAKAGTSSVYYYLKQHPEVYMSPVKEPRFITAQFREFHPEARKNIIKDFEEYKNLFEKVTNEKAIGEASTDYLYYYENSIKLIKKFFGDVKIIIILRNPIDAIFSGYQMHVRLKGKQLSFEDILKVNGLLDTGSAFYYKQVKAYLDNFNQVKVYLYDDLVNDTASLIKDIFRFLEVDTSFVPDINTKHNVGGIPKNKFIFNNIFVKSRKYRKSIKKILKIFFSEEKVLKFLEKLRSRSLKKQKMKPETREYLKNLYREDILKLQELIKRDLSHWLK